jgi:hypothetical protein
MAILTGGQLISEDLGIKLEPVIGRAGVQLRQQDSEVGFSKRTDAAKQTLFGCN